MNLIMLASIFVFLWGKEASQRLILSMHIVILWRMAANSDFMWSFCFDLYARWSYFLKLKMLAHLIKFENCFAWSIGIKDFCIFKDKLTLFFCSKIVWDVLESTKSLILRNNIILKPHLVNTSASLIWLTKKLELILMRTKQKMSNHFLKLLM